MTLTHKAFKYGVEVCEWTENGDKSYSVRKSYKDKATGEYKDTKKYFARDIYNLKECCDEIIKECGLEPYDPDKHGKSGLTSKDIKPSEVAKESLDDGIEGLDDDMPF